MLIRAIIPRMGIETMMKNRNCIHLKNLTNGPAKIIHAFQITKKHYGVDLTKDSELFIAEGNLHRLEITTHPRIGIKKGQDKMWNFQVNITNMKKEDGFC